MRNYLCNKGLRHKCSRPTRRAAFSLAELIVSIGVLLLMLSLAGQVFNLTIKSTGQAMALTDVSQLLRAFEDTLREDLRHVQGGRSLMLIQGNPVNTYWTRESREADDDGDPASGYPHQSDPAREDANGDLMPPRADILMFFTARKGTSAVDQRVTSNLQQVVYGHAVLGEYVPPTGGATSSSYVFEAHQPSTDPQNPTPLFPWVQGYPSATAVGPVPAARWHLSRRGVLLLQTPPPPNALSADSSTLDDVQLLGDETAAATTFNFTDVVWDFRYVEQLLRPAPQQLPTDQRPWSLPNVFYQNDIVNRPIRPFARSRLDLTPPPLYAGRLGAYFLPGCASFRVEWALDPRSEFVDGRLDGEREIYWFDPGRYDDPGTPEVEHPLGELEAARDAALAAGGASDQRYLDLDSLLDGRTRHPDANFAGDVYSLADRFLGNLLQNRRGDAPVMNWPELAGEFAPGLGTDARPNLVVFGAARRRFGTQNDFVPEDIFPGMLRITVDLFDAARRLERPIRHVIVVPVGG